MNVTLPEEVSSILNKMKTSGYEIYLVGGAVRDLILGKMVNDWDFTTNATPEQILEVFPDGFYNNRFGTVGVPAKTKGFDPHEITTYRTEQGYSDNRRPDNIVWGNSLKEDVERRDFTINAMALDSDHNILDFFNGKDDLDKKIIRTVGEPTERFAEDALRLIRAIRIATQLGFSIEENTFAAIKTHASLINKISKERVRDELLKIIASPKAHEGVILLKESGLLSEIIPELEKTFGVEQKSPNRHHIYDVGTHCIKSLENCKSTDPIVRFATLIHDIGKPQTYKKLEDGTITFYNHELVSAKIAKNISLRLKLSKDDSEKLYRLVRWHQFSVNEGQTDSALRRFIVNVGKENIDDMLTLRVGDRLGGGASETSWRLEEFKKRLVEVQKQPFTVRDLKISGLEVMEKLNLTPGPKIGEILQNLFKKVEEKEIENEKEVLLAQLENYKD
jgi:putative nucleotidyltransferase with HDIG domain